MQNFSFEHVLQKQWPVIKTQHYNIYYQINSTAENEIDLIARLREEAFEKTAEYFGYTSDISVDLYLFEDAEEKREITGHTGAGWAYGTSMIEVYNKDTKVHIKELLSFEIGSTQSKPGISYRQAASLVEFIIVKYGKNIFLHLYQRLNPDYTEKGLADNISTIEESLNCKIGELEKEWINFVKR